MEEGKANDQASILDLLKEERIVSFKFDEDDNANCKAIEQCDNYFYVTLSKSQMIKLADEIKSLANEMKEED